MELREAIASRRSTRAYTGQPVPRAKVEELLATAVQAPSGMNMQPWAFGVVQGTERLQAYSDRAKQMMLASITPGSPLERYIDTLNDPSFNIFYTAETLVLIFANNPSPMADGDCTMAAYTLMLAAWDQGLGSCWIGFAQPFFSDEGVKAELGIPAECHIVAPIILGYPAAPIAATERQPANVLFWKV